MSSGHHDPRQAAVKLGYTPLGLIVGAAAGVVAGVAFKQQ